MTGGVAELSVETMGIGSGLVGGELSDNRAALATVLVRPLEQGSPSPPPRTLDARRTASICSRFAPPRAKPGSKVNCIVPTTTPASSRTATSNWCGSSSISVNAAKYGSRSENSRSFPSTSSLSSSTKASTSLSRARVTANRPPPTMTISTAASSQLRTAATISRHSHTPPAEP